jgi:hypothetical protein
MKFKKSAEITKLLNSEPTSFMIIIQQEQAKKRIVFIYTIEPYIDHFSTWKVEWPFRG